MLKLKRRSPDPPDALKSITIPALAVPAATESTRSSPRNSDERPQKRRVRLTKRCTWLHKGHADTRLVVALLLAALLLAIPANSWGTQFSIEVGPLRAHGPCGGSPRSPAPAQSAVLPREDK